MVAPQDTIEEIAKKYNTTVDVIYQINGFSDDYVVVPGTQIVVPKIMNNPYRYYTVKKGDNLYRIAKDFDIDYQLLIRLNGLDADDYIYPNQTLILPKDGYQVYLTQDDDTIDTVLDRLNITLDDLLRENRKIYLRPEQIIIFKNN